MRRILTRRLWPYAGRIGAYLGAAALVVLLWVAWPWLTSSPDSLDTLEKGTRLLAFGSAALFILYKLTSGFFLASTQLDIDVRRTVRPGRAPDDVAVTVTIQRGQNGTLLLRHAFARLSVLQPDGSWNQEGYTVLAGTERLSVTTLRSGRWLKNDQRPMLLLPPGDKTVLGYWLGAPRGLVCLVDVVIAGKTTVYWRSAQWRASKIALPLGEAPQAANPPQGR